jgi:hypothetical protein
MVSCTVNGVVKKVFVMANRKSHAKRVSERNGLPAGVQKKAQVLNKDFNTY